MDESQRQRKKHTRKPLSPEHKEAIRQANLGPKNKMWKGDAVGYEMLHWWVARNFGRPAECNRCGKTGEGTYEWANKSGTYQRLRSDWFRLCKPCHTAFDRERGPATKYRERYEKRQQLRRELRELKKKP